MTSPIENAVEIECATLSGINMMYYVSNDVPSSQVSEEFPRQY